MMQLIGEEFCVIFAFTFWDESFLAEVIAKKQLTTN
jgi:hypothetical protein